MSQAKYELKDLVVGPHIPEPNGVALRIRVARRIIPQRVGIIDGKKFIEDPEFAEEAEIVRVGTSKAWLLTEGIWQIETIEKLSLPPDVGGVIFLRSTLSYAGNSLLSAWIDAGFRGHLRVALVVRGRVLIGVNDPFAQAIFVSPVIKNFSYNGTYQER